MVVYRASVPTRIYLLNKLYRYALYHGSFQRYASKETCRVSSKIPANNVTQILQRDVSFAKAVKETRMFSNSRKTFNRVQYTCHQLSRYLEECKNASASQKRQLIEVFMFPKKHILFKTNDNKASTFRFLVNFAVASTGWSGM